MKHIINLLTFLFNVGGRITEHAVNDGLVDLSGQGRDRHGR